MVDPDADHHPARRRRLDRLAPARSGASRRGDRSEGLTVQVLSLDWKWLFIYPDQRVAAVNTLTVPVGAPLHLRLTSGSVMTVFFIPQLGSMIYTMNGMVTRLELRADTVGDYQGLAAHFSGDGFPDMLFDVHVVSQTDFSNWASSTVRGAQVLNGDVYKTELLKQSVPKDKPVYRLDDPLLFHDIAIQAIPPGPGPIEAANTQEPAMFGKLSWSANFPSISRSPLLTGAVVIAAILAVLLWVVVRGHLPYLWREWITSVDHKRIGVMYTLLASVMLLRGFADAIMMRAQQALAFQSNGFLPPEHYNQIFSAHGTIMIFFVAMPFVIGLMNLVVPLQLGVRDVAFPTHNTVCFWLTATGALLVNVSRSWSASSRAPAGFPIRRSRSSPTLPGVGVDYYTWSLEISGVGTLVAGINLVVTVLKIRTRGMTYMRMPIFCWTTLAANLLIVAAFPNPDRDAGDADPRPLSRLPLLHQRSRRQHDDVHEPDLGLGPSRGLYLGAAGLRHLLGSGLDLLGQAVVRLPLDGARHHGDLRHLLHGVAASFFHDGSRPQC